MNSTLSKLIAVLEVILVRFGVVTALIVAVNRLFPGFEEWQTGTLGFAFPVFGDVIMVACALAAILAQRKSMAAYGITFKPARYHLDIAGACFLPVVLSSFPLAFLDFKSWGGAIILSAVQVGLLFALAFILRKKPSVPTLGMAAALAFLPAVAPSAAVEASKLLALFLTYALFVGFGEEIIYRGYMQSRLDDAFGTPYRFYGIPFGWGTILSAALFGFSHMGVIGVLFNLGGTLTLAWGLWTFFGGLVFSLVRQKTGSILAPALLHGLPQAIAVVAMAVL